MAGFKFDLILGRVREKDSAVFTGASYPKMFSGIVPPNGVITPSKAGDEYIDTATGLKYYSTGTTNTSWVEYNFTI